MDSLAFGLLTPLLEPMPCIGLAYLAGAARRAGAQVHVLDTFASRLSAGAVVKRIDRLRPRLVGISCLTPVADRVMSLGQRIRALPDPPKVVLGNLHAGLFAEDFLLGGAADYVAHGEAEETLAELIEAVRRPEKIPEVRGVSYIEGDEVKKTGERPPPADLDALPGPYWDVFPIKSYGLLPFADMARPTLTVLGSRGCPYRCSYCSVSSGARGVRLRSVESVVEEIADDVERHGVKQIGFVDAIFPYHRERAFEFCELMIRRGLNRKVSWLSETRADCLDEELLKTMKTAGCGRILLGLESGSNDALKRVNKTLDLDRAGEIVNFCRKIGIGTVGLFMIGLPGETAEETRRTVEYALGLPLDFAKFALTVPFPGSPLYDEMAARGVLAGKRWEDFTTFNPDPERVVYVPEGRSAEELIACQRRGHRRFYLRPRVIARLLLRVRSLNFDQVAKGMLGLAAPARFTRKRQKKKTG